jgi:hypothetical protein
MISGDADALQFWYRTDRIGLTVIEYDEGEDEEKAITEMYIYSSSRLEEYNCNLDGDCENTVDDLTAAWYSLLFASAVCAFVCLLAWVISIPRNAYPCLYNTKAFQSGEREKNPVFMWFVQPIGLTYLLALMYAIVFGIQFVTFFKYVQLLPSNEEMHDLSLHYMNNDPTLCSVSNPCEFSFESIDYFTRNVAFIVVGFVCAALAGVLVISSHRLKLQSIRFNCLGSCCSPDRSPVATEDQDIMPAQSPTRSSVNISSTEHEHPNPN